MAIETVLGRVKDFDGTIAVRTVTFARDAGVTAQDVAEVLAFMAKRPRRVALNEILLHPVGQA